MKCEACDNTGWVCEAHPDRPSGAAAMPCLVCNQPEPGERPRLPAGLVPLKARAGACSPTE